MTISQDYHLLLLRHAKSDWKAEKDIDFERPLTERGESDAGKVARWMKAHKLFPDRIVSSPAVRTRATADIVTGVLHLPTDLIRWENDIYEATLDKLLAVISRHAKGSRCLLLIGHNPGLDNLVTYLASAEPHRTASGKLMTTAALAIFVNVECMGTPVKHSLQLRQLVRPKLIT